MPILLIIALILWLLYYAAISIGILLLALLVPMVALSATESCGTHKTQNLWVGLSSVSILGCYFLWGAYKNEFEIGGLFIASNLAFLPLFLYYASTPHTIKGKKSEEKTSLPNKHIFGYSFGLNILIILECIMRLLDNCSLFNIANALKYEYGKDCVYSYDNVAIWGTLLISSCILIYGIISIY